MRILQLSKKYPFPIKDGECLAITELAKSLCSIGAEVSLLAMDTIRHPAKDPKGKLDFYKNIYKVSVDNSIKPFDAFLNLFSSKSYHIERFVSDAYEKKLAELLKANEFEIIQLETTYLGPYIPIIRKYSKAKIVLRTHNLEHEIWERIAKNSNPLKRIYLSHLAKKLKKFEVEKLNQVDFLAAISQKDLNQFRALGYKGESRVVPIGLDTADYLPSFGSFKRPISIGFIGSLDWMPNQEGLRWFLENIWQDLKLDFKELELHIAGRNSPSWIRNLNDHRIKFHGEVNCAKSFINDHSIMLVPLLSGSGMRAKILEGMALGKVVLTTSIGLEGIQAQHKEEVLIANDLKEFKESIDYCYRSNGSLEKIGRNALGLIEQRYQRDDISKAYLAELEASFLSLPV